MVLLVAFSVLYPKSLIHCLHCDHGWRKDSHLAVDFLKVFCEREGIHFHYKQFAPGEIERKENAARKKRYEYFTEICKELNIHDLFLAHNLDDDIETIVFRIFRGSSTAGLRGIPIQRKLNKQLTLHRPLLGISRSEIEEFFNQQALQCIEDSSNTDTSFARNKIRYEILPKAKEINSRVLNNISRLAEIIGEEQDFINICTDKALNSLGDLPWDLGKFRALNRALRRKILERTFTTNISFCNAFMRAVDKGGFHRINYAKDKFFTIKQKKILLETV